MNEDDKLRFRALLNLHHTDDSCDELISTAIKQLKNTYAKVYEYQIIELVRTWLGAK